MKKAGIYLMLTVILTALVSPFLVDCVQSAVTGKQEIWYAQAAVSTDGALYAAGVQDGQWLLAQDVNGRRKHTKLERLGLQHTVRVDQLFACSGGGAALSLYEQNGEQLLCQAWYLSDSTQTLLYSTVCSSEASARVFGFSQQGDRLAFLVWAEGCMTAYRFHLEEQQVQKMGIVPASSMYALPDGTVSSIQDSALSMGSGDSIPLNGIRPSVMWPLEDGALALDSVEGVVWQFDGTRARTLLDLEELPGTTSVYASSNGTIALVQDGNTMLLIQNGISQDVSAFLYRPRWQSIAALAALVLGILLLAGVALYFLWEVRRMQLSLLLWQGTAAAVILLLLVTSTIRWVAAPYYRSQADAAAERYLAGAAADSCGAPKPWTTTAIYLEDETLHCIDFTKKSALSAKLLGSDYRQGAETALETGSAFLRYFDGGVSRYVLFSKIADGWLNAVSVDSAAYQTEAEQRLFLTVCLFWAVAGIALVILLVTLGFLLRRIRRVTAGLDALQKGYAHVEVVDHSGDELGAMAESLNELAAKLRMSSHSGDVYTRFLPNQIVELLGVSSVEEITKQTFSSREMTTMHVSFSFVESVYESRSKELFDNINEVTERVSQVVSAKGGIIFSFSYEGFDALFDAGSVTPVSAAVEIRQEIIALNQSRQQQNLSPVTLRIALDTGEVMLGVVGDENRMQASAISSSFNTTRVLTSLFDRFEANILCTERMVRLTKEYGVRYIGKTRDGTELLRVYEIYDGDDYEIRKGKTEMASRFADGVFTLYAGDYAAAKRIFMGIVRQNSGDGVARFYLYLADRFEKEPPSEISMDT